MPREKRCLVSCRTGHDWSGAISPCQNILERVALPENVCAQVLDKSSPSGRFLTVFNTHIDLGFQGWMTVEIANLGQEVVCFKAGDPLCQFVFYWLDEATEAPYRGKYQNQERKPVGPQGRAEQFSGMRLRVVDLESSGLEPPAAEIVELAFIDVDVSGREVARYQTLVRPLGKIDIEARAVHHITDDELACAPRWPQVAFHILATFPKPDVLVAHRSAFEKQSHMAGRAAAFQFRAALFARN